MLLIKADAIAMAIYYCITFFQKRLLAEGIVSEF